MDPWAVSFVEVMVIAVVDVVFGRWIVLRLPVVVVEVAEV